MNKYCIAGVMPVAVPDSTKNHLLQIIKVK